MSNAELRQLAGAVVMVGFRGLKAEPGSLIAQQIRELHLGGVILFDREATTGLAGRNIVGPEQLRRLTADLQTAADRVLLIAVDQEGGSVARLHRSNGFRDFPPAAELGEKFDAAETGLIAEQLAAMLHDVGVNVNFAPVVDLAINPENPIIARRGRSFSENPQRVIAHAEAFVRAMHRHGVTSCLKHFPGHGSGAGDTHLQRVDITTTWRDSELEPYRRLANKTGMVMMGHLWHRGIDAEWPASLSKRWIEGELRGKLGFEGVVVSDDLEMAGAAGVLSLEQRVIQALQAGVDLLLFGNNLNNDLQLPERVVATIETAIMNGQLTPEQMLKKSHRLEKLILGLRDYLLPH
ncbi:MAG: Beta-hexosaminidase A [Phycisphaerae bacterium]|nr:Beta-hexosaminidase A [Phycisphaerae bacterium]